MKKLVTTATLAVGLVCGLQDPSRSTESASRRGQSRRLGPTTEFAVCQSCGGGTNQGPEWQPQGTVGQPPDIGDRLSVSVLSLTHCHCFPAACPACVKNQSEGLYIDSEASSLLLGLPWHMYQLFRKCVTFGGLERSHIVSRGTQDLSEFWRSNN